MNSDTGSSNDTEKGQFFYSAYADFSRMVYEEIRREAFGEDIGQFSWLTAAEYRHFFTLLDIGPDSDVLDVACGSGGPALFMASATGCRVVGMDLNDDGVRTATEMALDRKLNDRVEFKQGDASQPLPFEEASFDGVVCIDAINHFYNRLDLLLEVYRILKPGGRFLFTDPITVTGMITREEMIIRSGSMGLFVFTPLGVDEHLIAAAGFVDTRIEDVTANIATVSGSWFEARANHESDLREIEDETTYESMQRFLSVVHRLSDERRLSRFVYVARKP